MRCPHGRTPSGLCSTQVYERALTLLILPSRQRGSRIAKDSLAMGTVCAHVPWYAGRTQHSSSNVHPQPNLCMCAWAGLSSSTCCFLGSAEVAQACSLHLMRAPRPRVYDLTGWGELQSGVSEALSQQSSRASESGSEGGAQPAHDATWLEQAARLLEGAPCIAAPSKPSATAAARMAHALEGAPMPSDAECMARLLGRGRSEGSFLGTASLPPSGETSEDAADRMARLLEGRPEGPYYRGGMDTGGMESRHVHDAVNVLNCSTGQGYCLKPGVC